MCRSRESKMGTVSFISNGKKHFYRDVLLIRNVLENAAGQNSNASITVTIRPKNGRKPIALPLREFTELIGWSYMRYISKTQIEKMEKETGQELKRAKKRKGN